MYRLECATKEQCLRDKCLFLNFPTSNSNLHSQATHDQKCQGHKSGQVPGLQILQQNLFLRGITGILANTCIRLLYGDARVPTSHNFYKSYNI